MKFLKSLGVSNISLLTFQKSRGGGGQGKSSPRVGGRIPSLVPPSHKCRCSHATCFVYWKELSLQDMYVIIHCNKFCSDNL